MPSHFLLCHASDIPSFAAMSSVHPSLVSGHHRMFLLLQRKNKELLRAQV